MAKPNPAAQLVEQEARRRGFLNFADFVDVALYHPQYGYYNQRRELRGRSGDYFTSLQVSPLFPQVMADVFIAMRETIGTEQFSLVELGSGSGEFLEGVLDFLRVRNELKGFRVWAVEKSKPGREKTTRTLSRFPKCEVVSSLDEIEMAGALEGCVFSNEFFDALPFRRARFKSGKWFEVVVETKKDGLVETERPLEDVELVRALSLDESALIEGQEVELRPAVDEVMEDLSHMLLRGYVLTFDYGYAQPALYHPKKTKGTWLCFKGHESNENILSDIGRQDITAHLNFTQLAKSGLMRGIDPVLFCSQGQLLTHLGHERIELLLRSGSEVDRVRWMRAVQQLVHPDAMGEAFWALLQSKGVVIPTKLGVIPNRLRRLDL